MLDPAPLNRVGGDPELLSEIVRLFREDASRILSEIEEALDRADSVALERAAHRFKGSLGVLAARRAGDAVLVLERIATAAICPERIAPGRMSSAKWSSSSPSSTCSRKVS